MITISDVPKPDSYIPLCDTLVLSAEGQKRLSNPRFQQFLATVCELERQFIQEESNYNY